MSRYLLGPPFGYDQVHYLPPCGFAVDLVAGPSIRSAYLGLQLGRAYAVSRARPPFLFKFGLSIDDASFKGDWEADVLLLEATFVGSESLWLVVCCGMLIHDGAWNSGCASH